MLQMARQLANWPGCTIYLQVLRERKDVTNQTPGCSADVLVLVTYALFLTRVLSFLGASWGKAGRTKKRSCLCAFQFFFFLPLELHCFGWAWPPKR